jgi:transposase-like protein
MDVKKLEAALDELLKEYRDPEQITGPDGLLKQLTKSLLERAMAAELTHHIGYEKHRPRRGSEAEASEEAEEGRRSRAPGKANSRNGTSRKRVKGDFGEVEIEVPRDRLGSFEPQILPKHQRRFTGFDDKILSMYARGMTTREIQGHLEEIYGVEVSPLLVSEVTEAVMEEVRAWQSRPLEPIYPIVYLDALMVKMRHEGRVENRAVYVAIGITMEGAKEVLGLWTSANEGAKFWLQVLTEMRNRGGEGGAGGLRGRAEGISGSDRECVPEDGGAIVHRAPGAQQPELCELEGAQAGSERAASDLQRSGRGRGATATGGLGRGMGRQVRTDRTALAETLAAGKTAV